MIDDAEASGTLDPSDSRDERLHRSSVEFGLDRAQAEMLEALVDAAGAVPDELDGVVEALRDADVAEASWIRWSDEDLLGNRSPR